MGKNKTKTVFVCDVCGEEYIQWQGKCSNCGNWNTLKEFHIPGGSGRSSGTGKSGYSGQTGAVPQALPAIAGEKLARRSSGMGEVDRVLGGGIVPGCVILLGGDPGIGKSTLLLQMAATIQQKVLYVSGEESPEQIKLRAERLGVESPTIHLLAGTNVDDIQAAVEHETPALLV